MKSNDPVFITFRNGFFFHVYWDYEEAIKEIKTFYPEMKDEFIVNDFTTELRSCQKGQGGDVAKIVKYFPR